MDWIIPLKVIQNLNTFEIQILSLACYLHDVGMAVQKKDVDEIKENEDFLLYKKQAALTNTKKMMTNY